MLRVRKSSGWTNWADMLVNVFAADLRTRREAVRLDLKESALLMDEGRFLVLTTFSSNQAVSGTSGSVVLRSGCSKTSSMGEAMILALRSMARLLSVFDLDIGVAGPSQERLESLSFSNEGTESDDCDLDKGSAQRSSRSSPRDVDSSDSPAEELDRDRVEGVSRKGPSSPNRSP